MSRENWFDPEDKTQSVIRPELQDKSPNNLPPNLLAVFSQNLLNKLSNTEVLNKESSPLRFFGGESTLYKSPENKKVVAFEGAISAPIGVSAIQTAISRGVRRVFVLGLCGAIDNSLNVGDIVLPTFCQREEGTSFHYLPAGVDATPDRDMRQRLANHLEKRDILYKEGKTVSTDAPYRQTTNTELTWRKNGILGVDMEMSAVFALCEHLKIPCVGLFVVSDDHDLTEKIDWEWNKPLFEENLENSLNLLMELTEFY